MKECAVYTSRHHHSIVDNRHRGRRVLTSVENEWSSIARLTREDLVQPKPDHHTFRGYAFILCLSFLPSSSVYNILAGVVSRGALSRSLWSDFVSLSLDYL